MVKKIKGYAALALYVTIALGLLAAHSYVMNGISAELAAKQ
jgi:hypothetical protein